MTSPFKDEEGSFVCINKKAQSILLNFMEWASHNSGTDMQAIAMAVDIADGDGAPPSDDKKMPAPPNLYWQPSEESDHQP